MQDRKILTLEEVLNLNRKPTLQEMVDLSIEDYTKYLYYKGIIKYIPESGTVWNYVEDKLNEWGCNIEYDPNDDAILYLKGDVIDEWDSLENSPKLNESLNIIEEGVVYIEGNRKINYLINEETIYILHDKYGKFSLSTEHIKHFLRLN